MTVNYVQSLTLFQAGAGNIIGATSVVLTNLQDIYGNAITSMTSFGSKGYITLEPDTSNEEAATFTGITVNSNGTVSLTGVSTILAQSPYTETSGLVRQHSGGTKVVITDNVAFWNTFANKNDSNTFVILPQSSATPTASTDFATKAYVDSVAVAGAPNATTTVKGIVQEATQAQVLSKTQTGSTGADLFLNPSTLASTLLSDYKVDTGTANAYLIAPSPALTGYTIGQILSFKALNANTTASTLNVNGLGVKTIKKSGGTADLASGDIGAGMIVLVEYDGTNFSMLNPTANAPTEAPIDGSFTELGISTLTATESIAAGNAVAASLYQSSLIGYDTSGATSATGNTNSIGANSNRIMVMMVAGSANSGSSCTISGTLGGQSVSWTNISVPNGSNPFTIAWGIQVAPPTGIQTFAIAAAGSGATVDKVFYWSLYNCAQVAAFDNTAAAGLAATAFSVTENPLTDGCIMLSGIFEKGASNLSSVAGNSFTTNTTTSNGSGSASSFAFGNSGVTNQLGSGTNMVLSATTTVFATGGIASVKPLNTPLSGVQKASSAATDTRNTGYIGFAKNTVTVGQICTVITAGIVTGLSTIAAGLQYYLNDTQGTIGLTAGSNTRKAAIGVTNSSVVITNVW